MTEQEYDEQVAPALADIADKVAALGGCFVARVEWQPGEAEITLMGVGDDAGIGQKLTAIASQCNGNIDQLYIACARRFDMSASIVARAMGWKPSASTPPASKEETGC